MSCATIAFAVAALVVPGAATAADVAAPDGVTIEKLDQLGFKDVALISPSVIMTFLPLPGRLDRVVENADSNIVQVALATGPDQTRAIRASRVLHREIKDSDLVILPDTGNSRVIWLWYKQPLGARLAPLRDGSGAVVGSVFFNGVMLSTLDQALKRGRVLRPVGRYCVALLNPDTGRPQEHITFEFGDAARIWWNTRVKGLSWEDIVVRRSPLSER